MTAVTLTPAPHTELNRGVVGKTKDHEHLSTDEVNIKLSSVPAGTTPGGLLSGNHIVDASSMI